ncbi:transcription factor Ouib-like [Drosophila guanche]|uniref:Blast:Putative zinc finger protein 286B n=1 Tax=Drosophila guanche TaxID=7266 RepID=A0A3B0JSQ2_DROGU|nr:transcription factor Ouib-like [Drosophila guanche]SPP84043.1 blast:Putative zinc finger protein 286B [Drosophila guanche]
MLEKVCRTCASNTEDQNALKLFSSNARGLVQQINLIAGILLQFDPDLPDWICERCQTAVQSAIEFREQCLSSQEKLKTCDGMPTECSRSASTQIICVRRSTRTQKQLPKSPPSPTEVMIKVENLSNGGDVEDDGVDHLETSNDADLDFVFRELPLSEDYDPGSPAKVRKGRRKRRSSEKSKKPKHACFFCDQCGTNITGKASFERHQRKHSGVRPFQCELCPARFLSTTELKGHQVMHTGARNYPCRYCERTYVNSSGRLRHERTHTNERPFVCSQCCKAFTNAYILKNHMRVHTGERLFRCELCQASFSRPIYLKDHYRSNKHKQNLERAQAEKQQGLEMALPQQTDFLVEQQPAMAFTIEVPLPMEQASLLDANQQLETW